MGCFHAGGRYEPPGESGPRDGLSWRSVSVRYQTTLSILANPLVGADNILIQHSNAADNTALPMVSGSLVPWVR